MKTQIKNIQPMMLLPPRPDVCQICAVDHNPALPHNAQSIFYQTKFLLDKGREAIWLDAMEHCTPDMKSHWVKTLECMGVDVQGGKINPTQHLN